jgi:hypothetical protein
MTRILLAMTVALAAPRQDHRLKLRSAILAIVVKVAPAVNGR